MRRTKKKEVQVKCANLFHLSSYSTAISLSFYFEALCLSLTASACVHCGLRVMGLSAVVLTLINCDLSAQRKEVDPEK